MALNMVFVILFMATTLSNGVVGRRLPTLEDPELDKQLDHLNKPAVISIRTKYGDLYDCVDFYKQPAFDHPLLKNQASEFQMSSHSESNGEKGDGWIRALWMNGKGCPYGTVPIKRTTKGDLLREKLYSENYSSRFNPIDANQPVIHFAGIETKPDPTKMYTGAAARMSLWNPNVTSPQSSSAHINIQNGDDHIQTGWRVDPALNGDSRTRAFIYTQAGQTQCFNTKCPGFVITRQDYPVDMVLQPVSVIGQQIYMFRFEISQDPLTQNWYLQLGENGIQVGFWPAKLFTSLQNKATYVNWEGQVSSPPGVPSPPMGSGAALPLKFDFHLYAHMINVSFRNETNDIVDASNTRPIADATDQYNAFDVGLNYGGNPSIGHSFFYGGPGGIAGN